MTDDEENYRQLGPAPNPLCRWLGHRRVCRTVPKIRHGRRGMYMGTGVRTSCERCGAGYPECYDRGRWERLCEAWREFVEAVRSCDQEPPKDDGLPF